MLRRANYVADMRLAQAAMDREDFSQVLPLLERHLPADPEMPEVRGFEWHYLWQLGRQER